jgi:hypothetical protein
VVALADTLAPLARVTPAGARAEAGGRGER